MRHSKLTWKLLAALLMANDVAGLHIDFAGNGHVAIDVETPGAYGSPPRSPPHVPLPPPRSQNTGDELKDRQIDLGYEIHQGFFTVCLPISLGDVTDSHQEKWKLPQLQQHPLRSASSW